MVFLSLLQLGSVEEKGDTEKTGERCRGQNGGLYLACSASSNHVVQTWLLSSAGHLRSRTQAVVLWFQLTEAGMPLLTKSVPYSCSQHTHTIILPCQLCPTPRNLKIYTIITSSFSKQKHYPFYPITIYVQ